MNKNLVKGFSLMELVVTITIIIILSIISGPIYKNYATKTKMAEAYALLGTIRSAQETYFRTYDRFLSYQNTASRAIETCYEETLGIDARPNKYYSLFGISGGYDITKGFSAFAAAKGYPVVGMTYNLTTGVTFSER